MAHRRAMAPGGAKRTCGKVSREKAKGRAHDSNGEPEEGRDVGRSYRAKLAVGMVLGNGQISRGIVGTEVEHTASKAEDRRFCRGL